MKFFGRDLVTTKWTSNLLAGIVVLAIAHMLSGALIIASLAQLLLVLFLLLGWPRFSSMARLLVIACILMSLFSFWWLPAPWVVLHEAAA